MGTAAENSELHLQNSELSALKRLGQTVRALQDTLPTNKEGLPLSYIDPQVISDKGFTDDVTAADAEEAIVELDYSEGFPTANQLPFWERLDCELIEYYNPFKTYRQLRETEGSRSIARVAEMYNLKPSWIGYLARVYHWIPRVKAYDIYRARLIQTQRQKAIMDMESQHSAAADELFAVVLDKLDDPDVLATMTPKDVVEFMKEAIRLKRLSLGLHPDKPSGEEQERPRISVFQGNVQVNQGDGNGHGDVKTMQSVLDVMSEIGILDRFVPEQISTDSPVGNDLIDVESEDADEP